jgi:XRN 5''-3'' exonuclease N-terminus.
MIKTQYKTVLTVNKNTDLLLIDGNCILHDVLSDYSHLITPDLNEIFSVVIETFEEIIRNHKKCRVYICLDGVPPLPKQLCQKRRRKDNLSISAFLLPGTNLMKQIETHITNSFQCDYININGANLIGEGEQKIIQILKKYPSKSATILSYDSDAIILSLILERKSLTLVEIPFFNMIVDVCKLFDTFVEEKLIDRLLWICTLCGNDFFPQFRQFKNLNTIEIFSLFKSRSINSFEDLFFENKCSCDKEDAELYVTVYKWYEKYFNTNDSISTNPYESLETPCVFCILKNKSRNPNFSFTKRDNHLSYVLSDSHIRNQFC